MIKALVKILFLSLLIGSVGCNNYDEQKADVVKNSNINRVEEPVMTEADTSIIETQAPEVITEAQTTSMAETTEVITETVIIPEAITTPEVMTTVEVTTTPEVTTTTVIATEMIKETIPEYYDIYAKNVVNIRVAPSSDSEVIGQTRKNEELKCIGKEGSWYIVFYEGRQAYVYAKYFADDPVVNSSVDDPYTYYEMEDDIKA